MPQRHIEGTRPSVRSAIDAAKNSRSSDRDLGLTFEDMLKGDSRDYILKEYTSRQSCSLV